MPDLDVATIGKVVADAMKANNADLMEGLKQILPSAQPQQSAQQPAQPAVELPKLDDPELEKYVAIKLKETETAMGKVFNDKLKEFTDKQAQSTPAPQSGLGMADVFKAMVPGLAEVPEDFDKKPMEDSGMFTWGDFKKRAVDTSNTDKLKEYVAAHQKELQGKAGDPEPPASPARQEQSPEPTPDEAKVQADRDADLALVMQGKLTQQDFDKKHNGT